jgi:hypothetical protein
MQLRWRHLNAQADGAYRVELLPVSRTQFRPDGLRLGAKELAAAYVPFPSPRGPLVFVDSYSEAHVMWKFFRKFVFVISVTLISGLISQGSRAAARPQFQDLPDFYHTAWNGLGAVFDIKQSSEGYLWLTSSRGVFRFDGIQFKSVG